MIETKRRKIDRVYSNYDHALNSKIAVALEAGDACADHCAWNYKGVIYRDETGWHEEIWSYGSLVEVLDGTCVADVIQKAIERHGDE